MTDEQISQAVKLAYSEARRAGLSPKRAHTKATDRAAALLGTQVGAWDLATKAQNEIDP